MASSCGNAPSEPAKMEQIITEFFAKSLHVILESRCPYVSSRNYSGDQIFSSPSPSSSSSSSSGFRPRDKWFNLALRDCPAAFENIDFWRQSNLEPVIVDIVLIKRRGGSDPLNFSPKRGGLVRKFSGKDPCSYGLNGDEFGCEKKSEKIIERWVIQYESKKGCGGKGGGLSGSKRSTCTSSHVLYKKSLLLLRSLYATVRLLPAYKLFHDLISSARIRLYSLGHRVSSFVEPFTRGEEADMQQFAFTPVDTSCGRLCLSVSYCSALLDLRSEPSTPMSPQFIPEYVGSPLAEPRRWFPSFAESQSSPSTCVIGRHHSWSYDSYSKSHAAMPFSTQDASGSDRQTISTTDKLPFMKDELRKTSDEKPSSNSSPTKLISRSSSRLTSWGGYDDSEFSGAFVLDDDGIIGLGSRSGSLHPSVPHKQANESHVGALVHMLQNAPPLRHDSSFSRQSSNLDVHKNCTQDSNKTTVDALNELREYGVLKDDLLKKGKNSEA